MISHSLMVAWKDLMELFRNKLGLIMLVLMPIFMMTMVGFIYPSDTSISDVSVALVNEDQGYGNYSASAMLIMHSNRQQLYLEPHGWKAGNHYNRNRPV
jgi:ABC-type Na+ efflux pump permease subunit